MQFAVLPNCLPMSLYATLGDGLRERTRSFAQLQV
jgi:hypothetical protein